MIYFDNAATTFPKPLAVKNAMDSALLYYGANPGRSGHFLSMETSRKIYEAREKAANFFGAENPEHVVFTQNCTHSLNTVIKGLLNYGDHVIISDMEHNSVLRPIHTLATRGVITYSIACTNYDDECTIKSFRDLIRPNTRAIISTHASNVFGIKLPIVDIANLAHMYGIYFILDAAQSAGTENINVSDEKIDFLCTAGHKGLYGPAGTGLLITKYGDCLRPLTEGGTGSSSADYAQPDFMPDKFESGTLNTAGIIGMGAGIDFVTCCGADKLAKKEMGIIRCIYDGISQIKEVKLYTKEPDSARCVPVLSFNINGLTGEETAARLNNAGFALRGGLHCAPLAHKKFHTIEAGGTARLSIGAFNTEEQGRLFVREIYNIVRTKSIECEKLSKKD